MGFFGGSERYVVGNGAKIVVEMRFRSLLTPSSAPLFLLNSEEGDQRISLILVYPFDIIDSLPFYSYIKDLLRSPKSTVKYYLAPSSK